jgi:hypothetical protein
MSWSSAIRMLITAAHPERQPGPHREPAAWPRSCKQLTAEYRGSLAHPGQPVPAGRSAIGAWKMATRDA